MTMLIEWAGKPPCRIRSMAALPVLTRSMGRSLLRMGGQELLHRADEKCVVHRLAEETIGTCLARAVLGRQDAEDEDQDVSGGRVALEGAADAEAVHARDQ